MLIAPLLKPLEEGFSHKTLGDIETACCEVLIQAPADMIPFLFIIQQVCFWLRERLDALAPVPADIHRQIKAAVQEPLQATIHSLEENVDTPSRVHQATVLITQPIGKLSASSPPELDCRDESGIRLAAHSIRATRLDRRYTLA